MDGSAASAVQGLINGYWNTQILHALASLSVADHLSKEAATAETLAQKTGASPDGLHRLLRAASLIGMVSVDANGQFASTPMLQLLRDDVPDSLRPMALVSGSAGHWQPWGRFIDAVKTGSAQSEASLGCSHFEHYARNPEEATAFIRFMQGFSVIVAAEVIRLLDTSAVNTVVDIGGADGALACALAAANPTLNGVIFDLEHSRKSASETILRTGLKARVSFQRGDFFEAIPAADLYLLKFILHDWDDAAATRILSNCRRAIAANGRVAIIEMQLGEMTSPGFGALLDLNMLTVTGGRERTVGEYENLLAAAGLKVLSVTPTRTPFTIIEASAA